MSDIGVVGDDIGREAFEGGVEVGYPVLGKQANEVEATDEVFAFRWRELGAIPAINECLGCIERTRTYA